MQKLILITLASFFIMSGCITPAQRLTSEQELKNNVGYLEGNQYIVPSLNIKMSFPTEFKFISSSKDEEGKKKFGEFYYFDTKAVQFEFLARYFSKKNDKITGEPKIRVMVKTNWSRYIIDKRADKDFVKGIFKDIVPGDPLESVKTIIQGETRIYNFASVYSVKKKGVKTLLTEGRIFIHNFGRSYLGIFYSAYGKREGEIFKSIVNSIEPIN